jgi:hypothetical protein
MNRRERRELDRKAEQIRLQLGLPLLPTAKDRAIAVRTLVASLRSRRDVVVRVR